MLVDRALFHRRRRAFWFFAPTALVLGIGYVAATWNATRRARAAGAGREDGAVPGPARRGGPELRPVPEDRGVRPLVHDPCRAGDSGVGFGQKFLQPSRCRTSASSSSGSTSRTTRCSGSGSRSGFLGFVAMLFMFGRASSSAPARCSRSAPPEHVADRRRRARVRRHVPRLRLRRHRVGRPQHGVPRRRLRALRRLRPAHATTSASGEPRRARAPARDRCSCDATVGVAPLAGRASLAASAVASGGDDRRSTRRRRDRLDGRRRRSTRPPSDADAVDPTTAAHRRPRHRRSTSRHGATSTRPRRAQQISPLILGVSSTLDGRRAATTPGITLNSWGGNPSTRYNYVIGHAWNHGADYEFRNTNYGGRRRRAARRSSTSNAAAGVETPAGGPDARVGRQERRRRHVLVPRRRRRLPAGGEVGDCDGPTGRSPIPTPANVESTPEMVADVGRRAGRRRAAPRLHRHGQRAGAVGLHPLRRPPGVPDVRGDPRQVPRPTPTRDPRGRARRRADRTGDVLLVRLLEHRARAGRRDRARTSSPWFLRNVAGARRASTASARSTSSTCTTTRRATCSTTNDRPRDQRPPAAQHPVAVGPRLRRRVVDRHADPASSHGCRDDRASRTRARRCSISEWNFGADTTMNGALAIADVLGIYGREGVDAAAYWRNPPVGQPGLLRLQDARQLRRPGLPLRRPGGRRRHAGPGTTQRLRRPRRRGRAACG